MAKFFLRDFFAFCEEVSEKRFPKADRRKLTAESARPASSSTSDLLISPSKIRRVDENEMSRKQLQDKLGKS